MESIKEIEICAAKLANRVAPPIKFGEMRQIFLGYWNIQAGGSLVSIGLHPKVDGDVAVEAILSDRSATKIDQFMNSSHSLSVPTTKYDGFLFAKVCDEASGMHLSVLSAMVRMNIDPWQKATALAAMPETLAVETMKSMLCLVSGKIWHESEATATAERLVDLLPHSKTTATVGGTKATSQAPSYWFVWVGIAMAFSLFSAHQQAAPNATVATSHVASGPLSKQNNKTPTIPLSH